MTTDDNACATPLLDLLRSVPLDARDLYSHGGPFETRSIPYGLHCHAAAAEIARLQAQVDALATSTKALKSALHFRFALIASGADNKRIEHADTKMWEAADAASSALAAAGR